MHPLQIDLCGGPSLDTITSPEICRVSGRCGYTEAGAVNERSSAQFGRTPVPFDVRDLTRGELRVAFVIAQHTNGRTDTARPSIPTIASRTRMTSRGVRKAIKGLEQKGSLAVQRHVGRGNTNVYTLLGNGELHSTPFDPQKGEPNRSSFSDKKGGTLKPEMVNSEDAKAELQSSPKQKNRRNRSSPASGAAAVSHPSGNVEPEPVRGHADRLRIEANREALKRLRVGEPSRTELAEHPDMTPQLIGQNIRHGQPAGAVVTDLRAALEAIAEHRVAERARRERLDAEARERKLDDLNAQLAEEVADEILQEHSDEAVEKARLDWLDEQSSWVRPYYEHSGLRLCKVTIAKRLDQGRFDNFLGERMRQAAAGWT